MAKLPALAPKQLTRALRTASELRAAGRMAGRIAQSGRKAGQDALLLLRPAVRHSTESPRQPGDRVRALGRVSVQSRNAVPERREALSCRAPIRIGCLIR